MARTIYRWRIDRGLAWHQELRGFDPRNDQDWWNWEGWSARLDLADRNGLVVIAIASAPGADGTITFASNGTISLDMTAAVTAGLTSTATAGRGKEKAQLTGTLYATDPLYPADPYAWAFVKAVVT